MSKDEAIAWVDEQIEKEDDAHQWENDEKLKDELSTKVNTLRYVKSTLEVIHERSSKKAKIETMKRNVSILVSLAIMFLLSVVLNIYQLNSHLQFKDEIREKQAYFQHDIRLIKSKLGVEL